MLIRWPSVRFGIWSNRGNRHTDQGQPTTPRANFSCKFKQNFLIYAFFFCGKLYSIVPLLIFCYIFSFWLSTAVADKITFIKYFMDKMFRSWYRTWSSWKGKKGTIVSLNSYLMTSCRFQSNINICFNNALGFSVVRIIKCFFPVCFLLLMLKSHSILTLENQTDL